MFVARDIKQKPRLIFFWTPCRSFVKYKFTCSLLKPYWEFFSFLLITFPCRLEPGSNLLTSPFMLVSVLATSGGLSNLDTLLLIGRSMMLCLLAFTRQLLWSVLELVWAPSIWPQTVMMDSTAQDQNGVITSLCKINLNPTPWKKVSKQTCHVNFIWFLGSRNSILCTYFALCIMVI